MRIVLLILISLIALGCPGEDEPVPVPGFDYPLESKPLHCWTSAHVWQMHDLGEEIAISYRPNRHDNVDVSMAFLTLLTPDEGKTFERPLGTQNPPSGEVYRGPLEASTGWFQLPNGYAISQRGIAGVSRLPGPEDPYTDFDWLLFMDPDREATDVLATTEAISMGNSDTSIRVWRHDGITVADTGVWYYASTDETNWEPVGFRQAADDIQAYGGLSLVNIDGNTSAVIAEDRGDSGFYLIRPGEQPQPMGIGKTIAFPRVAESIAVVDERVILLEGKRFSNGSGAVSLVVQDLEANELNRWPWPSFLTNRAKFAASGDGTIWVLTEVPSFEQDQPGIVMVAPGQDPVRLNLNWEAATFDGVPDALGRPDGRVLFSARTKENSARRGTRHFGSTMFCEIGPGVEQGIEPMATKNLYEAPEPGEVIRVARIGAGTSVSDRFSMTPAGTIWATYHGELRNGPPDQPRVVLDAPAASELPTIEAYTPATLLDYWDTGFVTTMYVPSNLLDPPKTQRLQIDYANPQNSSRSALAFGDEQVYDVQTAFGTQFWTTDEGTFLEEDMTIPDPDDRRAWGRRLIFGKQHAFTVDDGYTYARGVRGQARPVQMARFDVLNGRVPDIRRCQEEPEPEFCINLDDSDLVAMRVNDEGGLYAVDFRHGRVVYLAPDSETFETVAEGFLSPSDLQLTSREGKEVVLVYDGDIFAFTPTEGRVAKRGFQNSSSSSQDLVGHSHLSCAGEDTPCVLWEGFEGLAPGVNCVPGRNFGAAGTVEVNGAQVEATWSDTSVCVQLDDLPATNALVRITREDGATTRPVPWLAPRAITGFQVPESVTPTTPIAVRGTNLQNGFQISSNAMMSRASDVVLEFLVPQTMAISIPLNGVNYSQLIEVLPEIKTSCATSATEICELGVIGLPNVPGTVTIGGFEAQVVEWSNPVLRVNWPQGLTPGEHEIQIVVEEGVTTGTVTLLERSVDVLIARATIPTALTPLLPRPVETPFGWLGGARSYMQFIQRSALYGVNEEGAFSQDILGIAGAATIQVVTNGTDTFVLGNDTSGISLIRVVEGTGESPVDLQLVGKVSGPGANGFVAGAGYIEDDLILVVKTFENVTISRLNTDTLETELISELGAAFGWENVSENYFHGAWVRPEGVYLSDCYQTSGINMARFVPLARDEFGSWSAGQAESPGQGFPKVACAPTEGGFAWVEVQNSSFSIYEFSPGNGFGDLQTAIPNTLPGATLDMDYLEHGILDLAKTPDGWALLLADRSQEPGLSIATWSRTTGEWTLGEKFGNTSLVEPGEVCVGPVPANMCDAGLGSFGCAPLACPILSNAQRYRNSNHAGPGYLMADEGQWRAFYQVLNTQRESGFLGGVEVQHKVAE